jgi:predicted alpha/beta-hydrolase family hydrolase
MKAALAPPFDKVNIQKYLHWQDREPDMDFDWEVEALDAVLEGPKKPDVIIARCMGGLVTLKSLYEGAPAPDACIFVGLPYDWFHKKRPIDRWLDALEVPSLFIQQEDDRAGSYETVQDAVDAAYKRDTVVWPVPGEDHLYKDIPRVVSLINTFLDIEQIGHVPGQPAP